MNEKNRQASLITFGQGLSHEQANTAIVAASTKRQYHPPQITVYGTIAALTKGSGGNYDDECTSGKWQDDDLE